MALWMNFCVLDVGQGSANYIELRDGKKLKAAAIVDVGSEQWKRLAGKPSAQWIAERLETMEGGAALDAVILSHSDSDHVNLIPTLLEGFDTPSTKKPTLPVLTVKRIYYGGSYDKYAKGRSRNFLAQLDDYRPASKKSGEVLFKFKDDITSFSGPATGWRPVLKVGGQIDVWLLSANTTAAKVPAPKGAKKKPRVTLPDGYGINARSIVVAVRFGGRTIVATGDATGLTLLHCNESLAKQDVRDLLGWAFMVTVPHHGSDTTTYDLTGSAHGSAKALKTVNKFVGHLRPDTITASAGERRTFRHPSARVIHNFGTEMLKRTQYVDPALHAQGIEEHFYTVYVEAQTFTLTGGTSANWPKYFSWWRSLTTGENVYTTDYFEAWGSAKETPRAYPWAAEEQKLKTFKPEPPRAISWAFGVQADGTRSVEVAVDRESGSAAWWQLVEQQQRLLQSGALPESRFVWIPSGHLDAPVRPIGASRDAPGPADEAPPQPRAAPAPEPPTTAATTPERPAPAARPLRPRRIP